MFPLRIKVRKNRKEKSFLITKAVVVVFSECMLMYVYVDVSENYQNFAIFF